MSFPELLKAFWYWWVTENGRYPYTESLAENRAFQLVFVVGVLVFVLALIFNKKFREEFF